ncbi:MAG TPA: helix-turn-helix transcriptional regulator, partial [Acidimicrobiia bacterium]|nr:helix-turn-helix transcriptional regulator [Acidimicrobiia bacterium]
MTPASNGTSATTDSSTTPAIDAPAGMPAERIGRRLLAMRRQSGLSARSAAALLGVSRADLRAFELGKSAAPHAVLDRLASIYGCRPSDLVDERNGEAVDVAPSHVQVGSAARRLSPEASDEEVLRQYLSAVYELRSLRPGSDLPLRDADLALLADVLGDTTDEIEARLVELIHCSRDEARAIRRALLRRRLAIPATGLLIGAGAFTPAAAAADENPALLVHRILDRVTAE